MFTLICESRSQFSSPTTIVFEHLRGTKYSAALFGPGDDFSSGRYHHERSKEFAPWRASPKLCCIATSQSRIGSTLVTDRARRPAIREKRTVILTQLSQTCCHYTAIGPLSSRQSFTNVFRGQPFLILGRHRTLCWRSYVRRDRV